MTYSFSADPGLSIAVNKFVSRPSAQLDRSSRVMLQGDHYTMYTMTADGLDPFCAEDTNGLV